MTTQDSWTTDGAGVPVASDEHSMTQGTGGGTLLHDHYLVEKMAQFNRERVPERVVHAKGGGAFGTFEVTGDVSRYTRAALFQPGTSTRMLARFSTVAGEQGTPDTWRDPRGFALKFYTSEGNYDLVGNNTPVFFVKDAMKFQDFIRSQKRLPDSGLRDNDMQWDFWTLSPESAHQVVVLMGDRGVPRTWRHMNGYGSHTFQWVNAEGEACWVKYHVKTDQGSEFLEQDEADRIAGASPDHHRQDLFAAIREGDFPSWTLHVQIIPTADAETYPTNIFDVTKTVSQKDYPLVEVGRMTLDTNPDNFHAQVEQAAFDVSSMVPGVGPSPDKMLMGRIFSYADAHRYRIGTNYAHLPVNAPVAPLGTYAKEGSMAYRWNPPGQPVYQPSSYGGPVADPRRAAEAPGWVAGGRTARTPYVEHAADDDWSQAGALVREVMDDDARARLVTNVSGHLLNGVSEPVLERAFAYWRSIDAETGRRVEAAVREQKPSSAPTTSASPTAPGDEAAER
ncbi:catalase [uncultured Pseudokineococcus sp.]|uniref:catalase n=1 Tax=uncultured Pseudokineococcus sp. TaxID=1642928 RepID=UPI00260A9190|nr:catalase [uncultured Pseudokineococcus sp.]